MKNYAYLNLEIFHVAFQIIAITNSLLENIKFVFIHRYQLCTQTVQRSFERIFDMLQSIRFFEAKPSSILSVWQNIVFR